MKQLDAPTQYILGVALDMLRKTAPRDIAQSMRFVAGNDSSKLPRSPLTLIARHIERCGPNDGALHALTYAIQEWDHESQPTWSAGTKPRTAERRTQILELLGFKAESQRIINERVLRVADEDTAVVIAAAHQPWYEERKRALSDFYWRDYVRQLEGPKGSWDTDAVSILSTSIDDVIVRLSDPTRAQVYPVKGLVMGHVQSGKTSHFNGLIAKASDAGYRLVIVLAGTLDILRQQTQRRIDRDIIGKELLGPDEYAVADDWADFVTHGGRPSERGSFDWERLTTSTDDYQALKAHLSVLEFKRSDPSKQFNHQDNLRTASAKLAVIKKVPARIERICDDLQRLSRLRSALGNVPTLIIDDESDQASVNTIDQGKEGQRGKRTSTNKAIGRLLRLLPRAQYVGYTATPFANVFIDPADAEDLFPKDFIISLPRPKLYMGVSDFYDFDTEYAKGDFRGNRNAFVRSIEGPNEDPKNLPAAIDSFILAGALKLYRAKKNPKAYAFRHHTMLIHHSPTKVVHDADRDVVEHIFEGGARYQRKSGVDAIEKLWREDFLPVARVRAPDAPMPSRFDELRPFVAQCLSKVLAGKAVRVVNGDEKNRDDTPAFDQEPVWAILVGGTKLSRGYTVEGLTVSYYRRPTGAGDTLMQMGRWFGFRAGYRDLVRLYIGSKEPKGRVNVDLYEAFGAICRDEEALRSELLKYSKHGLLPSQVPPLVRQHLPQLPPTSRNKRLNAEIRSRDFAGEWTEKTSASDRLVDLRDNGKLLSRLLAKASIGKPIGLRFRNEEGKARNVRTIVGSCDGTDVLGFLEAYEWAGGRKPVALEEDYIRARLKKGGLKKWLLMLPQASSRTTLVTKGSRKVELAVIERARVSESRFGVYSEPRHREAAAYFARVGTIDSPNRDMTKVRPIKAPVLVVYLVTEAGVDPSQFVVGFGIQYPGQKNERAITWQVRDKRNPNAIVV